MLRHIEIMIMDYLLNIAASCTGTRALGPGLRSVVWVQGCPFSCKGCISPDWIPAKIARQVYASKLAEELLSKPKVQGFTISGGEPFLQPGGITALLQIAKLSMDIDVICYTGYTLESLQRSNKSEIHELLSLIDVIIDGPYIQELDDNLGLRGSKNQKIHFLTDRLLAWDFETGPRNTEIFINNNEILIVGIPSSGVYEKIIETIPTS